MLKASLETANPQIKMVIKKQIEIVTDGRIAETWKKLSKTFGFIVYF